jgi:hypothetical protein
VGGGGGGGDVGFLGLDGHFAEEAPVQALHAGELERGLRCAARAPAGIRAPGLKTGRAYDRPRGPHVYLKAGGVYAGPMALMYLCWCPTTCLCLPRPLSSDAHQRTLPSSGRPKCATFALKPFLVSAPSTGLQLSQFLKVMRLKPRGPRTGTAGATRLGRAESHGDADFVHHEGVHVSQLPHKSESIGSTACRLLPERSERGKSDFLF